MEIFTKKYSKITIISLKGPLVLGVFPYFAKISKFLQIFHKKVKNS